MGKVKCFIHNLSFRTSFILYVVICTLIAFALILVTISLCQKAIMDIHVVHLPKENPYYVTTPDGEKLEVSSEAVYVWKDYMMVTDNDWSKIYVLNLVKYLCIPFYSVLCLIIATMLFYRNKMKKPLEVLRKAYQKISDNDLDFTVSYNSKDEMGQLVESFEKMRVALLENNQQMWRQMEQRKQLNAAFAHDLRTPLTVLKGYTEILENESKENEIKSIAVTIKNQIDRMERYIESMSSLQKMEDLIPNFKNTDMTEFLTSVYHIASMTCKKAGKCLHFESHIEKNKAILDKDIIIEVIENLISNAVRYAKSKVCVNILEENNILTVTVQDDGTGFSPESLNRATEPYYSKESDRSNHFGLGLYICKMLCEHHHGKIQIENTPNGAKVISTFLLH